MPSVEGVSLLFVNHYAAGRNDAAGTRHWDLGRELAARGHHVRIVASAADHIKTRGVEQVDRWLPERGAGSLELRGLSTPRYRGNGLGRVWNSIVFAVRVLALPSLSQGLGAVVGSSPHPLAALSAQMLARRLRKPFIFEIRDLWPETLVDMGALRPSGRVARVLYRLERHLAEHADAVVSVVPGLQDYFVERDISVRDVAWIPNAFVEEPEQDFSGAISIKQELGLSGDSTVLLYAGAHGPANDVQTLVDAAARCLAAGRSDIHWVLIGEGSQREDIERSASAVQNCHLLPPVPKAAVTRYLRVADGLVFHITDLPVFRYGICPNKLIDYLASGTPVIYAAPKVPGPADLSLYFACVQAQAPAKLAEAAIRFAEASVAERRRLGAEAAKRVRDRFMIQRTAADLEQLVQRVFDRKGLPAIPTICDASRGKEIRRDLCPNGPIA